MMDSHQIVDLCDFLAEADLAHYYQPLKNELKITSVLHLKYASDEDLKQIGLSKPEIRRLRKFYEKKHGYLSKIKRLLQNPKPLENGLAASQNLTGSPNYDCSVKLNSPSRAPTKHIIPADSISVNKQLGVGEFGIVQQGVWTNGNDRIQVAIKCLCRERMQSNPVEFLKEAGIMHSIDHENIVRLYGVVLDTENLMLVTELAPLRSLLECLKDSGLRISFLTVPTLCDFAVQICNGMMYLENKRLIHRDLAARNILVFSKDKVKISDFGLSRSLGVGKDYYQTNFNVNLKLPIAWCAPECINFLRFTNASDVWAYGVCLWEIFSYGFQPWAALTGHQILEAIDEPNYQRLEQPDCCPREYYALMLKCWQHDQTKRPRFVDIYAMLPDMKPEQVKTVISCSEQKKDCLVYHQNEIITVLDKTGTGNLWKGVLNSGKTGLFNPTNTVTYLGSNLPSSTNTFGRTAERGSRRKLKTEMISRPQNDLKHTGHVGLDGAYFGDVSFLTAPPTYNHLPRQVVAPYKPSDDIEQAPLLLHPTTPTSPDSIQTASGYFPDNVTTSYMFQSQPKPDSYFDFSDPQRLLQLESNAELPPIQFNNQNPFVNYTDSDLLFGSGAPNDRFMTDTAELFHENKDKKPENGKKNDGSEEKHEYHEISDDEIVADLGPSLVDEMDFMFRSMSAGNNEKSLSPDFDQTNKKNEMVELTSKLHLKNQSIKSKKKASTVKPLSVKDDKILSQAIEFAHEFSARSMTDLVSDSTASATQSPKRKFSFRFPLTNSIQHTSHSNGTSTSVENNGHGANSAANKEKKNFSEDLKNLPDLQHSITEDHKQAYNSLVDKPTSTLSRLDLMKPSKIHFHGSTNGENRLSSPASKTLPKNFSNSSPIKRESHSMGANNNPLRILRDKGFTTFQNRIRNQQNNNENVDEEGDSNAESPSYLTNINTYSYPETNTESLNPIPLPPRNKPVLLVNKKRHIRKHALIIPACSVQRTLNKLDSDSTSNSTVKTGFNGCANNNNSKNYENSINRQVIKTYENFDEIKRSNLDPDTASLHFETILESVDHNILDDRNDKFANPYLRLAPKAMPESSESYSTEDDDLAVDSVDGAKALSPDVAPAFLQVGSSNSVSCEDLLEFSEKKPRGRERGVESDEVRIMTKVLGTKVAPELCIHALELIEWDVHKAIKIVKLQGLFNEHRKRNNLSAATVGLDQCAKELEESSWDIHKVIQNKSNVWNN